MPRSQKILQFINWRIRVTIQDSRCLVGTFMAFDKHMNMVLGDCEEFRRVVPKGKKGKPSSWPLLQLRLHLRSFLLCPIVLSV